MEPGYKTSEFWYNILITVLLFILVVYDKLEAEVFLATVVQALGYTALRGYRKSQESALNDVQVVPPPPK